MGTFNNAEKDQDTRNNVVDRSIKAYLKDLETLKPMIVVKTGFPEKLVGRILYGEVAVVCGDRTLFPCDQNDSIKSQDQRTAVIKAIAEYTDASEGAVKEILSVKDMFKAMMESRLKA